MSCFDECNHLLFSLRFKGAPFRQPAWSVRPKGVGFCSPWFFFHVLAGESGDCWPLTIEHGQTLSMSSQGSLQVVIELAPKLAKALKDYTASGA